ncbi:hypothetical protein [Bacillus mycoides]|uniref:hypothetical protein n=1 Tax=Bacillus mycoides TaxID=1405 RepID=UPI0011A93419|nr:hypothetical protein [Bacillus mycoides]
MSNLKTNELITLELAEYAIARARIVYDLSTGNISEEFKKVLNRIPIEKQLEIIYHESLIVAVAKMIVSNNQRFIKDLINSDKE